MLGAEAEPDGATIGVMLGAGAEDATGAAPSLAPEELSEVDPEPPQFPVGALRASGEPAYCTESPASGNLTSAESTVAQPLPMLA